VASEEDWERIRRSLLPFGTPCFCGCRRRAESLHHLVGRGQGGDDVLSNLVPLSGDGTRLCHGAITSANRTFDSYGRAIEPDEVRRGIRENMGSHHVHYVTRVKSEQWLDDTYPRR
jgi:hypothetical protein